MGYLILFFLIIALDRISKSLILQLLIHDYYINYFCSLRLVFNRGIMGGALYFEGPLFWLITSFIIVVYVLLMHYTFAQLTKNDSIIGETMVLAGGLSNIIDRFLYGGVVDFILLSYQDWSWPIFNVADVAIVLGVGYMILISLRS